MSGFSFRVPIVLPLLFCAFSVSCVSSGSQEPQSSSAPSPQTALAALEVVPRISSFSPESYELQSVAVTPQTGTFTPESSSLNTSQQQQIVVSKEVFTKTFSAVEELIANLNVVVRNKDYRGWVTYLSDEYRGRMSAAETLKQLSESPTLQRLGVSLKTLEDYFSFVVVPSRANMRLDDLVFLSETDVEAIMVVGNRRVTVYRLIKIGDQWKIGPSS